MSDLFRQALDIFPKVIYLMADAGSTNLAQEKVTM